MTRTRPRGPHSRPIVATVLLALCVSGCGGVWAGHTDLRVHGGATANTQLHWENEPVGEHRSGVAGVSADVQLRVRKRAALGGIVATANGWVPQIEDDYARFGAYTDRYHALSLAPTLTLLGENVIIRAGLGVTLGTGRGQRADAFRAFPVAFVRLEPGRPRRRVHPVIQVGSTDGFLWDARIVAGGASFSFPRGALALGAAAGARIGPALHGTRVAPWAFATRLGGRADVYGWLELNVRLTSRAGLLVSIQAGSQLPVGSLGLRWDLDVARPAVAGAIRAPLILPSGR